MSIRKVWRWDGAGTPYLVPATPGNADPGLEQMRAYRRSQMQCSPAQMRLALQSVGRLEEVEQLVAANPSAKIVWEYATVIVRDSPLIDALRGDAFTVEEVDELFLAAMEIEL